MPTTKKFRVKHGLDAGNNTISFVNDPVSANDAATKNYVDIQVGLAPGDVSNSYLTSTFTTNTDFQSYVANTNSRIDTLEAGGTLVTNAYLTSTFTTNTDFQSFVANTNAYIATKTDDSTVLATNTALRTLIDDRMQVANTNLLVNDRIQVANADAKYATWTALTTSNTAIRSYVDTEVAALVNSAPTTLDTLDELASALGDDANFSTTVLTLIGTKASNSALTSTYVTNTVFQSALANTNSYIATKTDDTTVLATNTALRTLISDRIQVANLNTTLADYWPSANVINYTAKYLEVANVESSSISVSNTA